MSGAWMMWPQSIADFGGREAMVWHHTFHVATGPEKNIRVYVFAR